MTIILFDVTNLNEEESCESQGNPDLIVIGGSGFLGRLWRRPRNACNVGVFPHRHCCYGCDTGGVCLPGKCATTHKMAIAR